MSFCSFNCCGREKINLQTPTTLFSLFLRSDLKHEELLPYCETISVTIIVYPSWRRVLLVRRLPWEETSKHIHFDEFSFYDSWLSLDDLRSGLRTPAHLLSHGHQFIWYPRQRPSNLSDPLPSPESHWSALFLPYFELRNNGSPCLLHWPPGPVQNYPDRLQYPISAFRAM